MDKVEARHIIAIDCCEHTLAVLSRASSSRITSVSLGERTTGKREPVDLIAIGVARYPVRRLFISQLRRTYPDVPLLIFRREEVGDGESFSVRAEFLLSDRGDEGDYTIIESIRRALPISPCEHMQKGSNYDLVLDVVRIVSERYSDPQLNLERVAREVPISPASLSRILNQQVGVSFRQLLRRTRIEEAKRMLASRRHTIKEIALRVGFLDTHYFSRSFKESTGLSASDYKWQEGVLA